MENTDIIIISEEEAGLRLDKILAQRFADIKSRSYFENLFDEEKILVNGSPVKKRFQPQLNDEIEVNFLFTPELSIVPEAIPLDIVYEDDFLIVINKPAGMVVHPAVGNWTGTFVNALMHHCGNASIMANKDNRDLRPGIVHRIDKETTGLLIAAKNNDVQRLLIQQFSQRLIHKEYLAICFGNPGNVTIDQPIGRHPIHRKMMAIVPSGRNAVSVCRSLSFNGELALVNIALITGRTHQIRVHLNHLQKPLVGDSLYGSDKVNRRFNIYRQMLHAYKLSFKHPVSGVQLNLKVDPPHDMLQLLLKNNLEFSVLTAKNQ
jgi:23S rRNA pseudouridine1911/1915/1917 synthase